MTLSKKPLVRVGVIDPITRKTLWSGTVYKNSFKSPAQIISKIKEVLS